MKIIPGVNAETTDLLRSIVSMNVSIMCRVFPPLTSAVDVTGAAYRYASAPGTAVQALRETGVYKQCTDVISSYSPAALLFREAGDKKRQEAWRLASPDFDLLYENQVMLFFLRNCIISNCLLLLKYYLCIWLNCFEIIWFYGNYL